MRTNDAALKALVMLPPGRGARSWIFCSCQIIACRHSSLKLAGHDRAQQLPSLTFRIHSRPDLSPAPCCLRSKFVCFRSSQAFVAHRHIACLLAACMIRGAKFFLVVNTSQHCCGSSDGVHGCFVRLSVFRLLLWRYPMCNRGALLLCLTSQWCQAGS